MANNNGSTEKRVSAFTSIRSDVSQEAAGLTGGHVEADPNKPTIALTSGIVHTYTECNADFSYSKSSPARLLTKPSKPVGNDGLDNENADLIVSVGYTFISTLGTKYVVNELLGHGTFGQVFKCRKKKNNNNDNDSDNHHHHQQQPGKDGNTKDEEEDQYEEVAIKVIKNQPAYYHQARVEIGVLQFLNTKADAHDQHHIVRLQDFFQHEKHLCLVFELLGLNLYEIIRHNKFKGLSLTLTRAFLRQLLDALQVLRAGRIVHCDVKPENVLLTTDSKISGEIKLIDFGSACFDNKTLYSYIQSRFYRSPEVVLGQPYGMSIDMWSLGCLAAELFLGLPLLPGASEHDLLSRIETIIAPIPPHLLAQSRHLDKYYKLIPPPQSQPNMNSNSTPTSDNNNTSSTKIGRQFELKSKEEFEKSTGKIAAIGKTYFPQSTLADIISGRSFREGGGGGGGLSDEEQLMAAEKRSREAFTDLLLGMLDVDPGTRWTPWQAVRHPFITGKAFTGPFQPPADPLSDGVGAVGRRSGVVGGGGGVGGGGAAAAAMSIPVARNRPSSSGIGVMQPCGSSSSLGNNTNTNSDMMMMMMGGSAGMQAHAQAHAAALAAVQLQMSLHHQQQQQQQQGGGDTSSAAFVGSLGAMPAGFSDGSLPHHQQMGASYGNNTIGNYMNAMYGNTNNISNSNSMGESGGHSMPMFSPPSRSFGAHLKYGQMETSALAALDAGALTPKGGVLPLIQTPRHIHQQQHQQHQQQQMMGSGSYYAGSGSLGGMNSNNNSNANSYLQQYQPGSLNMMYSTGGNGSGGDMPTSPGQQQQLLPPSYPNNIQQYQQQYGIGGGGGGSSYHHGSFQPSSVHTYQSMLAMAYAQQQQQQQLQMQQQHLMQPPPSLLPRGHATAMQQHTVGSGSGIYSPSASAMSLGSQQHQQQYVAPPAVVGWSGGGTAQGTTAAVTITRYSGIPPPPPPPVAAGVSIPASLMPEDSSTGTPCKPGSTPAPGEHSPLPNVPSTGTAGGGGGGGDDLDAAWDPLFDTADDVGAPSGGGGVGGSSNSSREKDGGSTRRAAVPSPSILPPPPSPPSHTTAATLNAIVQQQQQQQPLPPVQLTPVITQTSSTLVPSVVPSPSPTSYHQQLRVNVPPPLSPQQLQNQQSQSVPPVPSTINNMNDDVSMMIPVSPLASNMVLGSPAHSESMMMWSPTTRGGGMFVGRASSQSLIDNHGGRQGVSNTAVVMNEPKQVLQGFSLVNEKEVEEEEGEEKKEGDGDGGGEGGR